MRSCEEDEELQQSTKKVTEIHQSISPERTERSYKAKLLGEIPGAYEQAFEFVNDMDTEVESDEDIAEISSGVAAVKLIGETKQRIWAQWANAHIVKVFGRIVGYHFLQSHLMSLWKLVGHFDCVDLGKDFFLVRFTVKEDYARVFKSGPWFVGGHYLSIRCWEPNFRPSSASVSSIAVWVRLPELPI